jgi:hypothetical protein
MGGGLLNLMAHGAENLIINGNPKTTYFKTVYKTHTNFGIQKFRVDYNGQRMLDLNKETELTFKIPRYADLVNDMYLVMNLPDIWSGVFTEIVQIVDLMIASLDERLRARDMGIELTTEAKALLAKRGYDPLLGARPLRRCIQREIEDVLSEKILFGDLKAAEIILVGTTIEDEKEIFTFKGMPKTEMPDTPGHLAEAPTPQ